MAKPLTNLLKKNALFIWTSVHEDAFTALKSALSSAPVLQLPNFSLPFELETDASAGGIGAVLSQQRHPIAFVSNALGIKNQGLSTYEKEYLVILMAIDQWRAYLQHDEFIIYTDQRSIAHLTEQKLNTFWQSKVFTKLLGLQYKVIYKKGVENGAADALSRRPSDNVDCYHISSGTPVWLSEVTAGYETDPHTQHLIAELTLHQAPDSPFQLKAGLLRYKGRIWVGANPSLQLKIVSTMHDSAIGGHSGFQVTYRRVHQLFAWPKMKSYIKEYVAACSICQQSKPDRSKYLGLLQALPIPDQAWQVISMDFIEALPKSNGADCILVVVDKFSKYGHFIPLAHPYTASKVAHLFMSTVYKLHGLPEAIISDRDCGRHTATYEFRLSPPV
jgi:hypothetical protein